MRSATIFQSFRSFRYFQSSGIPFCQSECGHDPEIIPDPERFNNRLAVTQETRIGIFVIGRKAMHSGERLAAHVGRRELGSGIQQIDIVTVTVIRKIHMIPLMSQRRHPVV